MSSGSFAWLGLIGSASRFASWAMHLPRSRRTRFGSLAVCAARKRHRAPWTPVDRAATPAKRGGVAQLFGDSDELGCVERAIAPRRRVPHSASSRWSAGIAVTIDCHCLCLCCGLVRYFPVIGALSARSRLANASSSSRIFRRRYRRAMVVAPAAPAFLFIRVPRSASSRCSAGIVVTIDCHCLCLCSGLCCGLHGGLLRPLLRPVPRPLS